MELTFWKGGGIAGGAYSTRLGPMEVGSLPRPAAGEIAALIEESGFFDLPARLPPGGNSGTDPLEYRLSVVNGARSNAVGWDDNAAIPPAIDRLAERLSDLEPWQDVPWESWHPAGH